MAGVNDATTLENVVLPNFPQRNLPDTQDDDIVLLQYYRSGHAYGMAQRNKILRQQMNRPPETKSTTTPQDLNLHLLKHSMANNPSSQVF